LRKLTSAPSSEIFPRPLVLIISISFVAAANQNNKLLPQISTAPTPSSAQACQAI
jgi:hypothetical protein